MDNGLVRAQGVTASTGGRRPGTAITPCDLALTSQQAADLLGVSRPTVKRWIERGELPAERVGARRHRLRLDDVLRYREARRRRQYEALAASAVDIDLDAAPEVVLRQLRAVRQTARRRAGRSGAAGCTADQPAAGSSASAAVSASRAAGYPRAGGVA